MSGIKKAVPVIGWILWTAGTLLLGFLAGCWYADQLMP